MPKELSTINRGPARTRPNGLAGRTTGAVRSGGFSLIEIIISSALILLLAILLVQAVLAGQEGIVVAGAHARANLVAEEGLEAVRNLRDSTFLNLVDGTYGLGESGGTWALVGTSDTEGIFTRSISISTIDSSTKLVVSTVTWPQTAARVGSVSLSNYITDFSLLKPEADSLQVDISGGHLSGSGEELIGVKLKNIGNTTIILSKIFVSWSGDPGVYFTKIKVNGGTVWSKTGPGSPLAQQPSGSTVTIQNVSMQPNSQTPINEIEFTQNISGNSFTLGFIMSDNSSTTVTTPVMP